MYLTKRVLPQAIIRTNMHDWCAVMVILHSCTQDGVVLALEAGLAALGSGCSNNDIHESSRASLDIHELGLIVA